jgi:O-antigen/teichoic acid export membrane protein
MGGRVARGTLQTILVTGAGAAISMVVQMGLSNVLGKEAFGTYLLVLGWLAIAQLFGKLELDVTSVRFVGRYVATEQWQLLRGFLKAGRSALITTSILLAVVSAAGIQLFRVSLQAKHPALPDALLIACVLLPVTTLLLFEGAILQGLQRYAQAQIPVNLLRPLLFGVVLLVITLGFGRSMTTPIAIVGNLLSAAAALGVAWVWRKRAVPAQVRNVEPAYDRATWVKTSYPLFAVSLGQVIISQQADVIVVAVMLTTAQAAVYGAASQLTMPIVLAAASVTYVAQSMIADLYSREPARLQSLVRAVTWLSAAVSIPIAVALIGLGPFLLSLYGEGMAEGHTVLIVLTLAQLVVGIVGALAGYLMTMTAHEREAAWIIGLTAVANLGLALLLTPKFGPVGTASATLVAAVARVAALRFYIRRAMGIRLPAF